MDPVCARVLRGLLLGTWLAQATAAQTADVPLVLYNDARWPRGLSIGTTLGAAFLDYDGDGWIDLYSHLSGNLWHNEKGRTWSLAADLDAFLPTNEFRYGSSCADYDNDGLPDIATEPRGDCFYLLKNLGGTRFLEIASDPALVIGQPCNMQAETACWADVDDDGDLDLFVPAYPFGVKPTGGGGNRFWENLGPSGPGGSYRLLLSTEAAGLMIPPGVQRPEGAQFCDVDRDGDVDAFSNHTLYQNRSGEHPSFLALGEARTGIRFGHQLDEGALLFDYDLDGDMDLLVVYAAVRNRLWENRGDGTFFLTEEVLESDRLGAFTGASAEDWDQDGDMDLTTASTFRRNWLVETGEPLLRIAQQFLTRTDSDSPAWGDWDRDGDPDCVIQNLSNNRSSLFRNVTYEDGARGDRGHSIRVRVVRDAPGIPGGLETEFGATVELRVLGDETGFVRRRFVASSHGYLQQSEYALTLALPPGPDPVAPAMGVSFALAVDFPSLPANGLLRIDANVNPALRAISLARLAEREITVFRSGKVVLDGHAYAPSPVFSPRLTTTGGGLPLPGAEASLRPPVVAPTASWYVGLELDASAAGGPLLVEELVLDGRLDAPVCGRKAFNVALWSVNAPSSPRLVWRAALATRARNRRHFLPAGFVLQHGERYRLVCRVTSLRASPLSSPAEKEPLRVAGGLSFSDEDPCTGSEAARAVLDPAHTCLWLRYRAPLGSTQASVNR